MTAYLDHAATTPLSSEVFAAMEPYLSTHFGNPSSAHAAGRRARFAIEEARERVAAVIGCTPAEVIFTSGGTESNNFAINGVLGHQDRRGDHLVTSAVEHEAVLRPAGRRSSLGHPVQTLSPDEGGIVDPALLDEAISEETGLVSLMYVNNELGSVNPIHEMARICRAQGVPLHSDAVQAPATLPIRVDDLGVDLLTLSGHKMSGPKGVGALYVRSGIPLSPLILGGKHERDRRAGTENVPSIVGFARALEIAQRDREEESRRLAGLRDRLASRLADRLGDHLQINTPMEASSPHILNVSIPPTEGRVIDGEMLLLGLDMAGVMVSAGSACASGTVEPSHVLRAIGLHPETAGATIRFSLGTTTTEEEIDHAAEQTAAVVARQQVRGGSLGAANSKKSGRP